MYVREKRPLSNDSGSFIVSLDYLTSTEAPASSSLALICSASSLETPSLTVSRSTVNHSLSFFQSKTS